MGKRDLIGRFKCCSDGKDLTCYYCLACKNNLHRSCVDRRKTVVYIKGDKIYCSKKCEESILEAISDEEIELVKELRNIIVELQDELREKDASLERQKRKSVAFESDVEEAEEQYKNELKKQQNQIRSLEEKLSDEYKKRTNENERFQMQIKENEERTQRAVDEHKNKIEALQKRSQEEKQKTDVQQAATEEYVNKLNHLQHHH